MSTRWKQKHFDCISWSVILRLRDCPSCRGNSMVNITRASAHGISEKNRRLLTSLHRGTSGPFTATEAAASLSVDIDRAQRFLAYLARMGWLTRVRRGLYAAVPLDAVEPFDLPLSVITQNLVQYRGKPLREAHAGSWRSARMEGGRPRSSRAGLASHAGCLA